MLRRSHRVMAGFSYGSFALLALATLVADLPGLRIPLAGGCRGGAGNSVGGVSVNTEGVLNAAKVDDLQELAALRTRAMQPVSDDLRAPSELRKISLRRLHDALRVQVENGQALSDEMEYLAGLQRVRYVFVYPEQHDIILAGFGEGWQVDEAGNVVGLTTGRPVLQIDDLLVALRSAEISGRGSISCSIDPTAAGLERLRTFVGGLRDIGSNPAATMSSIEEQLGPQIISVTGVPTSSRFARVMVAADFRMKRLAMNFEPAPVAGLPSYLQMTQGNGRGMQSMLPRWWLTTHYEPLVRDEAGLAWELKGPGVKAMAEDDYLEANGRRTHTGRANAMAQKWADNMTARYEELSVKDPIFGELRNIMDLSVVATLIAKEQLAEKAGVDLSLFKDAARLPIDAFYAPRQTDSKASFVRKGTDWVISASGGVQILPRQVVREQSVQAALGPVRQRLTPTEGSRWWWN